MKYLKGRIEITKLLLAFIAVILLVFAIVSIVQQESHSSRELQAHTQTLVEIKQAVEELKANNQADHDQTVKYINCVLVGITTESPSQSQILTVYQECLANSGVIN